MSETVHSQDGVAAEWAAAKAISRFFRFLDSRDYEAASAMFAPDGSWVRLGKPLTGPQAVYDALVARPATLRTRHMLTNLLIEPEGPVLRARYYLAVYDDDKGQEGPAILSAPGAIFDCDDRLLATPDGWRFASRKPALVFKKG